MHIGVNSTLYNSRVTVLKQGFIFLQPLLSPSVRSNFSLGAGVVDGEGVNSERCFKWGDGGWEGGH